jgi:hypothetical protein
MDFYTKYLKYKAKYLQLKKQVGGEKPFLDISAKINLFHSTEMEKYLNPIYGLILCESGYICNNFYLHKNKFIQTEISIFIEKICKEIPGSIQPTNPIMVLTPYDFGTYIAIKYIFMKNIFFETISLSDSDKRFVQDSMNKLINYIPIHTNNEEIYFHIILYCMCWTANNHTGILEYYQGIHKVFTLLNKYLPEKYSINPEIDFTKINIEDIKNIKVDNKFEKNILNILKKPFNIYNQQWSNSFCKDTTYADCGETTARNLINLICYDTISKFDIDELKEYNPISQLIEYYKTFTNFNDQSDNTKLITLDEKQLNARDAWSYLIIKYASKDINFVKTCDTDGMIQYDLNDGLAMDGITSNFFQLIKNLLTGIKKWDDIKSKYIEKITDHTNEKGFGEIYIEHKIYNLIKIYCVDGHYYMDEIKTKPQDLDLSGITTEKQNKIDILLKQEKLINMSDYIWIDINSDMLVKYINDPVTDKELKIKLLELSLSTKYDKDARRRIEIDVHNDFFNDFYLLSNEKTTNFLHEYTYLSKDFNFINKLKIKHLNHKLKGEIEAKYIKRDNSDNKILIADYFKPIFNNITSIGDGFMSMFIGFNTVDLKFLGNVTSIGDSFMSWCNDLETIDFKSLSKLTSIGNLFMFNCNKLKTIIFPTNVNIKLIGHRFMAFCKSLKTIDLTFLSKAETIGNSFMKNCNSLETIDLKSLSNIVSIGDEFMSDCTSLETIDLTSLSNIISIGKHFMFNCSKLKKIKINKISKFSSILQYDSRVELI